MTASQAINNPTQSPSVKEQSRKPGQYPTETMGAGETVYGTPFDRFRPLGGGADGDLFRRYHIGAAEEADFLTYWAETRTSAGIFARDATGTLVFRISTTNLADVNNELDIGRPGAADQYARWIHVYDAEGTSWLTQFRRIDLETLPKIFDGAGKPVEHNGRLGLCGPSGQTVQNVCRSPAD
ncbi:hypothetical protein SLS60_008580 [Paraconiothyrium brasiliense]|uniref:Uncharacterized protein n=1 Tax=Paraconiothyrium brasiliense TaxID=300254 RepID=A0ABR3QYA3_9PLEO